MTAELPYPIWYIFYNLFLVLVAGVVTYGLARLLQDKRRDGGFWAMFFGLFLVWLAFFPNTIYLVAEFRHIFGFCAGEASDICSSEAWLLPVFFVYSWIGYFSFVTLLYYLQKNLYQGGFKKISLYFPVAVIPVLALGMLLGLVDRFNSYDLIFNFCIIARRAFWYLTSFDGLWLLVFYSGMMYLLFLAPGSGSKLGLKIRK
ncbi:MAG: DUF1361 domain-containing protein [bacterium]